jgi:hypothetical protein
MEHDDSLDDELDFLGDLPRTASLTPGEFERLAERLRDEGLLRPRRHPLRWLGAAAAAAAIFALGAFAGARYAQKYSLEQMLARTDLTVAERVLVLQRAGSAYVRAAQGYADATAHVDSTAVEVASQVLLGAAHAVARNGLDAGLSHGLTTVLTPVANRKPVIWF